MLYSPLCHVVVAVLFVHQHQYAQAVVHQGHDYPAFAGSPETGVEQRMAGEQLSRWTNAAFDYLRALNCDEVFFTTAKECRRIKQLDKEDVNAYVAGPSVYGKVTATLPDGGLSRAGAHDAVVVIDPYPEANFGHLVMVFFMDLGSTQTVCEVEGGNYLGE